MYRYHYCCVAAAGHDADTCLGKIAATATAAVAVVAVNDALAIAGAAIVAGDAGVEEADAVAAVAERLPPTKPQP